MEPLSNGNPAVELSNPKKRKTEEECAYLDTVQRWSLDFDFEPSCSVSLESGPHVYGCLICGKFYRGRGRQTPAYTHSVDEGHFVFVHLDKGTFHCLPDDFEVKDPSLADISAALHPTYSPLEMSRLDSNTGLAKDLFQRRYLPGYVGLNNLNKTDCVNACVQALAHVRPLRDFFLKLSHKDVFLPSRSKNKPPHRISHLVQCFGELVRKMWSDKRFKSHVDPHMLIQAITVVSKKRFRAGSQAEAGEFMTWFLNQIHIGLGGSKKSGSSIIYDTFQGNVQVTTHQRKVVDNTKDDEKGDDTADGQDKDEEMKDTETVPEAIIEEVTTDTHFLQLTLDIPEKPLFRDDEGGLVIPQEPLVTVLKKFDGLTFSDALSRSGAAQRKRYRLLELPNYLILHLARFKTNRYSREKNPTIVAFPVKNLDLSSYVFPENAKATPPTEEQVRAMGVSVAAS
jgi:U4/U6.U5 tri-snRNP-associated protein 2